MAEIIQEIQGDTCEPCIAYHNGMVEYFDDDATVLAHAERHATEWSALGVVTLDALEEEPQQHFGNTCIVCGNPPYAGAVYDYTLTVFRR